MFSPFLITNNFGTRSRRTLSVRDAEAFLPVVPCFTLAHSVVRGRARPLNHSISLADVGAVQALGQKVPELCEVFLGTGQTRGVESAGARRRHVRPRGAQCTGQQVARFRIFIIKGVLLSHGGVSRHHEQKHGHWRQLGKMTRKQEAVSL